MKQALTHSAQLGRILADRRRAAKLSQRTVAAKLAISQNRLSEIESDPASLTVGRLLELMQLLGLQVTVEDRSERTRVAKSEW